MDENTTPEETPANEPKRFNLRKIGLFAAAGLTAFGIGYVIARKSSDDAPELDFSEVISD